jgi:nicotinamide mononucleotide adenylyltransferase
MEKYLATADRVTSSSKNIYSVFFGRYQTWHEGHRWLIDQRLKNGKKVWLAIRDVKPCENNPFTALEVVKNITKELSDLVQSGLVIITVVPDIESVNFGRGVGYDVIEHVPSEEISKISASQLRKYAKK